MAQTVKYSEDGVKYTQGPFVAVELPSGNLRVEVECIGHECPVLPDASIYILARKRKLDMGNTKEPTGQVQSTVDLLNSLVLTREVFLNNNTWMHGCIERR